MAITPVTTFRLGRSDRASLRKLANQMEVNQTQAIRWLIRKGRHDAFDFLPLSAAEMAALQTLATGEGRDLRAQAAMIIRRELAREGMIILASDTKDVA